MRLITKTLSIWLGLKIRQKILAGSLFAMLPLLAIVFVTLQVANNASIEYGKTSLTITVDTFVQRLNGKLLAVVEIFHEWAYWMNRDVTDLSLEPEDLEGLKGQLLSHVNRQPGFVLALVTNANGKVLLSTDDRLQVLVTDQDDNLIVYSDDRLLPGHARLEPENAEQKGQRFFARLVSAKFPQSTSPKTYLLGSTLTSADGEVAGMLIAYVDWSLLQNEVDSAKAQLEGAGLVNARTILLDQSSQMVLGHSSSEEIGRTLPRRHELTDWLDGQPSHFVGQLRGEQVVYSGVVNLESAMNRVSSEGARAHLDGKRPPDILLLALAPNSDIFNAVNNLSALAALASILAILFAVGITVHISRSIFKPIREAQLLIQDLRSGDLTRRSTIPEQRDELFEIAAGINILADGFENTIRYLSSIVNTVSRSSAEMSSSMEEQTAILSGQSSAFNELTTTMEELAASSKQIANLAEQVKELSEKGQAETMKGAEAVEAVMSQMSEITDDTKISTEETVQLGKQSKEISGIIDIINNIADQTKLLAFNAALEASSAGEYGKRFGVVAIEIRRLADSVMESTSNMITRVEEIQKSLNRLVLGSEDRANRIELGMNTTATTGEILKTIVEEVGSTTDAAKQISLATQKQNTATDQVLLTLKELRQGVQESSATIQQVTTAIKDLAAHSGDLKKQVESFRLSEA